MLWFFPGTIDKVKFALQVVNVCIENVTFWLPQSKYLLTVNVNQAMAFCLDRCVSASSCICR